jgi:hypothetical protein
LSEAVPRKTHGLYVGESIFKAFTEYAAKHYPMKSYEVWEKALIYYMKNHPLEDISIIIQGQVKSETTDRLEAVHMALLEKYLRLHMCRLVEKDGNPEYLRRVISKEIKQGVKIKHPSPKFLELLEEAVKLI